MRNKGGKVTRSTKRQSRLVEQLRALTSEERKEVLWRFCRSCGDCLDGMDWSNTNYCSHCSPDPRE